jgi:predicted nucleic acid-binding protein
MAAVAASRGLPLVTRDGDFDPVDGVAGLSVIKV